MTFRVPLRRLHLDRLRTGDELCRTLAALVDVHFEQNIAWRRPSGEVGDVVALLHDPLTVACVVERSFVTIERLPVTVAMHDGLPRTVIDELSGKDADVVRFVDAVAFANRWLEVVLGG